MWIILWKIWKIVRKTLGFIRRKTIWFYKHCIRTPIQRVVRGTRRFAKTMFNRFKKHVKFVFRRIFFFIIKKINIKFISDENYLKILYSMVTNSKLNLDNPKSFNEKIQWLKLNDRKDIYTLMADKYEVKKIVSEKIGEQYLIPTYGIFEKFDDINFDNLPNKFVIKSTHSSGTVCICDDKKKLNKKKIKKSITKDLKKNYFYQFREWPYKNIKGRIIIEENMREKNTENLNDYKIYCFNGKPELILVCSNRNKKKKNTDFFDLEWNKLDFTRSKSKNSSNNIKKPNCLSEMIHIAEKLSEGTYFLRVDLYEIENRVYFGELTFYPSSGFENFNPKVWNDILGEKINLGDNI